MEPPNIADNYRYEPAGYCIYCRATSVPLSDEHTFSDGMGGGHILPSASCRACQKVINEEFEQYCLRTLLGNIRTIMEIRSKKSKKRKRPAPPIKVVITKHDGSEETIYPKPDDLPGYLTLPFFPRPGIFREQHDPEKTELGWWWRKHNNFSEWLERHDAKAVRTPDISPEKFARYIAKTAHAHAIASIGDCFEPALTDIILGKQKDWWHLIGCAGAEAPTTQFSDMMYITEVERESDGQRYALFTIQFFSNIAAPIYFAVLGKLTKRLPLTGGPSEIQADGQLQGTTLDLPPAFFPMGVRPVDRPQ